LQVQAGCKRRSDHSPSGGATLAGNAVALLDRRRSGHRQPMMWIVLADVTDGMVGGLFTTQQKAMVAAGTLMDNGLHPNIYLMPRTDTLLSFTKSTDETDAIMMSLNVIMGSLNMEAN
jgi:hypothetical protein